MAFFRGNFLQIHGFFLYGKLDPGRGQGFLQKPHRLVQFLFGAAAPIAGSSLLIYQTLPNYLDGCHVSSLF